MHILMTSDCAGGVFVYSVELARELSARGCQISLAVLGGPLSEAQRAELAGSRSLELYERRCSLEWMDDPWTSVAATGQWLLELASELEPDCIHLNDYAHGGLAWQAPVVMVGHSCVASWWQAVKREPAPARYDHYRRVVQAGLAAADCVIAPSAAMMIELCRRYGPFRGARVIPNGIALSAFAPARKEPQLLAAGRLWDEAKNIAALQRCAAGLDWPVYIAGAERTPEGARCDYTPCRWLGALSRPDLSNAMAQSEMYVLPARYEPFGLSVLEAAASGCALVLGRIPSLLENWYGAACFVDPEDPTELARALRRLIASPEQRADLQARARLRARGFSAAHMARAYHELYAALKRAHSVHGGLRCAS